MALPPTTSAGKSLSVSMPCSKASWTSPGVATPGIRGMPLLWLALGEGFVQTRADGENRACVFDGFELFGVGNRTRADDGVRHFFGKSGGWRQGRQGCVG